MPRKIDLLELTTLYECRPIWRVYYTTKAYVRVVELDIKRWAYTRPPPKFLILSDGDFGIYIEEIKEDIHIY